MNRAHAHHWLHGAVEPGNQPLLPGAQDVPLPAALTYGGRVGDLRKAARELQPWLSVEHFEYVRRGSRAVAVELLAALAPEHDAPSAAALLVDRRESASRHRAIAYEVEESDSGLLWLVRFDLPLQVVECRNARFTLATPQHRGLSVPAPELRAIAVSGLVDLRTSRLRMSRLRRPLVALGTGFAVALASGTSVGVAAAGTTPTASTPTIAAPPTSASTTSTASTRPPTSPPSTTTTTTTPASTTPTTTAPPVTTTTVTTATPSTTPAASLGTAARSSIGTAVSITRTDTMSCKHVLKLSKRLHGNRLRRLLKSKAGERCITGESTLTHHEHAVKIGGRLHPAVLHAHAISAPATGGVAPQVARHIKPAVKPAVGQEAALSSTLTVTNEFAVDPFTASILARYLSLGVNIDKPPAALVAIYKAAGKRYRVPWQILAAINAIETDYGHDLAVSPKGAIGWMQFMPGTWSEYGVSVTGPEYGVSVTGPKYGVAFAGVYEHVSVTGPEYFVTGATAPNPYDARDAIFSAARYLRASGAPRHMRRALFAYNHAVWYVDEVVWTAEAIIDHGLRPHAGARVRIANMRAMAAILNGEPYVYGGGHGGWGVGYGYDCSGFVSAVLHAGGYLRGPQDTQTLPDQRGILNGPGKWVTIFDRTDTGSLAEDHVIIDIKGQWWESGGGGSAGAPSVHRMRHVSVAYLAEFNRVLHPRGL